MPRSPKSVFETIVSHGLGDKTLKGGTLGLAFQGVKESIDELKNSPDTPTADPTLPSKVSKNTDDIKKLNTSVNKNTKDISELKNAPAPEGGVTLDDLATATATLPYRLETDKILRKNKKQTKAAVGGEIQLVDNTGSYHNIIFKGEHGITTLSDMQGIVVDGSSLMPRNLLNLPVLE